MVSHPLDDLKFIDSGLGGQVCFHTSRIHFIIQLFLSATMTKKSILPFSLDFKTVLSEDYVTQVLSLDFKKTPLSFNWNFPN